MRATSFVDGNPLSKTGSAPIFNSYLRPSSSFTMTMHFISRHLDSTVSIIIETEFLGRSQSRMTIVGLCSLMTFSADDSPQPPEHPHPNG